MLFDVSLVYRLDSSTLMCIIFQALIQLEQTSPESISGQCLGWVVEPLDFLDLCQNLATWMAWAGSLDAILSLKHIRFPRRFNPFDPVWMYFLRSHLVLSPWLAKQKKDYWNWMSFHVERSICGGWNGLLYKAVLSVIRSTGLIWVCAKMRNELLAEPAADTAGLGLEFSIATQPRTQSETGNELSYCSCDKVVIHTDII